MVCAQQTIVTVVILAVRRLRLLIVLVGKQTKILSFEFVFFPESIGSDGEQVVDALW